MAPYSDAHAALGTLAARIARVAGRRMRSSSMAAYHRDSAQLEKLRAQYEALKARVAAAGINVEDW